MRYYKGIMTFLVILILLFIGYWIYISKTSNKEDVLIDKINKLELKLDSINSKKDSIRTIIDSTHIKIINNEKHYKEVINTIVSSPDSVNDIWTKQYINDYRQRLLNRQ